MSDPKMKLVLHHLEMQTKKRRQQIVFQEIHFGKIETLLAAPVAPPTYNGGEYHEPAPTETHDAGEYSLPGEARIRVKIKDTDDGGDY